jgi:DNA-binding transcriptional LysR family regulator
MTIQTEDIAAFLAVVREGSFGRAASSLLVSQPAISDRMARLEHEVGARLFHRTARGATLTPAGDAFVPYAERTIDLLADAAETLHALQGAPRLRLAVHTTFAHRVVPLVLRSLDGLHRSLKVRDAHSDAIVAALLDGACDAGFIVPGARPRQLRFVTLPPDPVVAVVAPSHPFATGSASMHDLAGHRVAFNRFGPGAAEFVERLRRAGVPEGSWTECSDTVTPLHLAIEDQHVAMVTKSLADVHTAHGAVQRLDLRPHLRWTVPLTYAYRRSDDADPALAAIRAAVEHLPRRGAA